MGHLGGAKINPGASGVGAGAKLAGVKIRAVGADLTGRRGALTVRKINPGGSAVAVASSMAGVKIDAGDTCLGLARTLARVKMSVVASAQGIGSRMDDATH